MEVRYDLFKCGLLTSYGFQLLTSQIVYPPPACALSPISTLQNPLDCCCVYCTFAVESWESHHAYGRLFNWKRVEWTFLHLKHMWGSAVPLFPLWESLLGLLAHYLFGCVLIGGAWYGLTICWLEHVVFPMIWNEFGNCIYASNHSTGCAHLCLIRLISNWPCLRRRVVRGFWSPVDSFIFQSCLEISMKELINLYFTHFTTHLGDFW